MEKLLKFIEGLLDDGSDFRVSRREITVTSLGAGWVEGYTDLAENIGLDAVVDPPGQHSSHYEMVVKLKDDDSL